MAMDILERYKPKKCPGRRSFEEMRNWIESRLDVQEISMQEFSETWIQYLYFNASHALTNQVLQLKYHNFLFSAYKLLSTEKNREYIANGEEYIYIVLEKKTGYILCNHSKLFLELVIARGVAQENFDREDFVLLEYVSCIAHLSQKEY